MAVQADPGLKLKQPYQQGRRLLYCDRLTLRLESNVL